MDYVHIYGKSFDLTDTIKDYINKAIESLKKYNLDITGVNVTVSADERKGWKGYTVEFDIHLAKKGNVIIKQRDKDVYAAIDLALNRASKVLRRYADKVKSHKNISLEEIMAAPMLEEEIQEALKYSEEVVPHNLDIDKPVEIEEAIEYLKNSDKYFIVFEDRDGKIRVLYKRTDGRFGLY
ncbi:ribosome hibernation-promoting factor, HPF/YfiA family [Nitrosophilus kaiyonis]|uniref:ribosome hibernation-promoting factor, HPF/YfiA family n=1 Tax=Nitrosophilus kaiyonis TaxID=2930200 RepID=UPI0024931B3E|nr:ribosome-associated translation inhibitor RaiA [Nitrosophilus kaiyonis]